MDDFFSYAYLIFKLFKKINLQCWYGWYSHFLTFYHCLSLSLELIYLFSGLEIQEPVKFQLGPVLRVLHAGITGHSACKASFSETMWLQLPTVLDIHLPRPLLSTDFSKCNDLACFGIFGKLARHFSSFKKTCSEMLNLNDQNLDFEGHTFFHKKFGIYALFDSLILHPSCLITTRAAPVPSRFYLGHTLAFCSNQDFDVATGFCFAWPAAFLYLKRSSKGPTKTYDHLCVCVVPYEVFVWAQ